ncbi:hypothetical protein [Saccharomonospora viridis]|jgi:hypothetical protein|uniref:DUF1440 domain-containing protein n=2 Tax=Saccharomonospora viridis TaxID=1852 RepID=C7MR36_SACVD|nr:hypothetical protein [Saccharomonospora viridis]ACU98622.1 hypothetical protein Svir_36710 [Saccharomonospora viridis DSM 43017]KHF44410.1 hypothetical protein MINT15_12920 [Saccharomonospora viridis]SFP63987.1 hypothetical protein SAMN02982918_2965 [Saccharomonospora viridis]
MLSSIARGAAAGAAGTTALHAATYLDMTLRGRPSSSTPQQTVDKLSEATDTSIPGDEETQENRKSGLGALLGMVTGTTVGVGYGALHKWGWRPPMLVGAVVATVSAMVGSNAPMTVLGVTDPRTWSTSDWLSDILPHLAYGLVTAATYGLMENGRTRTPPLRNRRKNKKARALPR